MNGAGPEHFVAGLTLVGGTHFAIESAGGVPSLSRTFGNEDGGGIEQWAFEPDEMLELAGALRRCAESAETYRSQR